MPLVLLPFLEQWTLLLKEWGVFWIILENTQFVDALPTAIMKPLSGGGARGMMVESWGQNASQINSFVGKLTSTLQGSTETTFYVLAVYFGSVGIRNTRYAVLLDYLLILLESFRQLLLLMYFGDK